MTAPSTYVFQGHAFNLIEESESAAIYTSPTRATFEVHRKREHKKDREFHGTVTKAGSYRMPSKNEWGSHAWTFRSLEDAQAKAISL